MMLKRILKSDFAVSIFAKAIAAYIRLVFWTSKIVRDPADTDEKIIALEPFIVAMWHGQVMMMPKIKPDHHDITVHTIVAHHGDGELMGQTLAQFGFVLIRGAGADKSKKKDKGGAQVLRNTVKALKDGDTVALTADFPPGPARQSGTGILTMAKLSGRPIVPCAMATSRRITLDNWDYFTINLPFSKLSVVVGDPIYVPRDLKEEETELVRKKVEQALNFTTKRAYEVIGESADKVLGLVPPTNQRPAPGFRLKAYQFLTGIARPVAPLILARRVRQGKEDPDRQNERLGIASEERPAGQLLWFHAASVGETNAVLPVISSIYASHPDTNILLTTGTVTSAKAAKDRLPPNAIHQYIPLDSPKFVERFLDHWRPDLALFTESEIWPNLILQSSERGIPLMLLNGRMSKKSFRSWRRQSGLSRPLFSRFDLVLAQNERLAKRFRKLGTQNAVSVGNLKIDCPALPVDQARLIKLQAAINTRPVFTAASTHPGEDEIIASAHRKLKAEFPDLLTIIIPRHPERGEKISQMLNEQGLTHSRRSEGALPGPSDDIYVADTIGELGLLYTVSTIAFIGGSAIPRGGQNPVEAVKMGTAVLTGPHWYNFKDAYNEMLQLEGCIEASNADEIAECVSLLLKDDVKLRTMTSRGSEAISNLSGALEKTLEAIAPYLPTPQAPQGMRRAS